MPNGTYERYLAALLQIVESAAERGETPSPDILDRIERAIHPTTPPVAERTPIAIALPGLPAQRRPARELPIRQRIRELLDDDPYLSKQQAARRLGVSLRTVQRRWPDEYPLRERPWVR